MSRLSYQDSRSHGILLQDPQQLWNQFRLSGLRFEKRPGLVSPVFEKAWMRFRKAENHPKSSKII
jgi:hypothetical protein